MNSIDHTLNPERQQCTIQFPGDLLATNTDFIRKSVDALISGAELERSESLNYIFDLTKAKIVDKTGLEFLKATIDRITRLGGEVNLRVADTRVRDSLLITRLNSRAVLESPPVRSI